MRLRHFIILLMLVTLGTLNIYGQENERNDVVKVGVYETNPYYKINDKGEISGYYHELFMLLQEHEPFPYEYIVCDFSEALQGLKDGRIDLILGVSVTPDRLKEIIYNQHPVAVERFALYSNDEKFNSLMNLEKVKVGLIEGSMIVQITLNYFDKIGLEIEPVYVGSWRELEEKFKGKEVDIIPHNANMEGWDYYKIFEFSGDQVYIAAHKEGRDVLDNIDQAILELGMLKKNPVDKLYKKYFGDNEKSTAKRRGLSIILVLLVVVLVGYITILKLKKKQIKDKIRLNIKNDKYLLQYQPIYNPQDEEVVAFEGLLRLVDEDQRLVPPNQFIPEIEENNMLLEVSLWILEKAINDYSEIKFCNCVKDREFYISINVSLKEIENRKFVEKASELLEQSHLGTGKICLEIVERMKVKELDKVSENLKVLKKIGFKIAIDDFGTEYSNLDRLLNLDTHIIKIDKSFVEEIDKDLMKSEIVNFVSRIAEVKDKAMVLEGVERESEARTIKEMKKEMIYVQGYYYNKPLFKEQIKFI